jgi:hypothetical protein
MSNKEVVKKSTKGITLMAWSKNNFLVIIFTLLAVFFALVSAANIDGGYYLNDNKTIAFVSYSLGSFFGLAIILVLPVYVLKKTLLRKNTWLRWILAIPILIILLTISILNTIS